MKKILIVDDEPSMLTGLSHALCKFCNFNGEIKTVENGKDALDEISSCFYDICFLDVQLPDSNGLDIMRKINEISPDTKVAIMTASVLDEDMRKKIAEGASLFISKPFNLPQIKLFLEDKLSSDPFGKQQSFPKEDAKERRQFKRLPVMEPVNCAVHVLDYEGPKWLNIKSTLLDISDQGIGIFSSHILNTGLMFRLKMGKSQREGIIIWSRKIDNHCKAGVKFL